MEVQAIKTFCSAMGFIQVAPEVRQNKNEYPFLTFYTKDNKAENIYFSKKGAEQHKKGDVVDAKLLGSLQVATVKNAEGEERTKLITGSERLTLADLLG